MLHDPVRELRNKCEILEEENAALKAKVAELNGFDELPALRRVFRLTNRQGRVLAFLYRRGDVSRQQLIEAVYDIDRLHMLQGPDLAINCLVKHLRRRLEKFGIGFESVYSYGYRMNEDTRAVIRSMISAREQQA